MDKVFLPSEAINEKQKRKLTRKQKKWLKIYIETGNATEAALKAYNVKNNTIASQMGSQLRKSLGVDELLEDAGVTDQQLTVRLREGLMATKQSKVGEIIDYDTRHKYLETALKLKGKLNNKVELAGENGGPIKLNILAGHGFIPNFSKPRVVNASPEGSADGQQQEVQSLSVAQTSQKDNDSGDGTSKTSTS
jgi:hypothetical protein